jgi:hypothetical protein
MTSAHEPGRPATAAATGTVRPRRGASSGRRSPQRHRSTVGMTSAGADADVLGMPVAWPATAQPVDLLLAHRIRAPRCPVLPPTGHEVGWHPSAAHAWPPLGCATPPPLPAAAAVLAGVAAAPAYVHAPRPSSRPKSGADSQRPPSTARPGRRSRTQPPPCLPVQARSNAARRRWAVNVRYHRPQCGAPDLTSARFSTSTALRARGLWSRPSPAVGPVRPDSDVVTRTARFLHEGHTGTRYP